MNSNIALGATILCFLSVFVLGGDCNGLFNKYLDRPELAKASNSSTQREEAISKWLKAVDVKPGSSIPSVLSQLEEAGAKETGQDQQDLFRFLVSLATSETDNGCQQSLFDFFLQIYKQVDAARQSELLDFMDYYGRDKFRHCID